jgi:hypothetical protein
MAVGGGRKKHGVLKKTVKKALKALGKMGVPVGMRGMGKHKKHRVHHRVHHKKHHRKHHK